MEKQENKKQQLMERRFSPVDLIILCLLVLAPLVSLHTYNVALLLTGKSPVFFYFLGLIGMLSMGSSYFCMIREFPVAGSLYVGIREGFNDFVGFLIGCVLLMEFILMAVNSTRLCAALMSVESINISVWVVMILCVVFSTLINFVNTNILIKYNRVVLVFILALFVAFVILFVRWFVMSSEFPSISQIPSIELSMIAPHVVTAVFFYMGFEAISTFGEEMKCSPKVAGKSILISITLVFLLFSALGYIAFVVTSGYNQAGAVDVPTSYEAALILGGSQFRLLSSIAMPLSMGLVQAVVLHAAATRILFSMSRDGYIPKALSNIHKKNKTPYVASFLTGATILLLCALTLQRWMVASQVLNFSVVTTFCVLHLAVISYFIFRKKTKTYIRHLLIPLIGIAICDYMYISLAAGYKAIGLSWMLWIVSFLVVCGIYYLVRLRFQKPSA